MVFLIAWCADLKVRSLNFLALLAGIILLLSPFSLYSISFLLSFGAVFGIITLVNRDYDPVTTTVAVGLASTVFTLPLQLYFFGTSNVLSVLTTVIMTPLVWAQMLMGLAAIAIPTVMIAPISVIEQAIAWLMEIMTRVSWYTLYVAKPPTIVLVVSSVIAVGLCFTKYRLASLLIMFMPLLPIYEKNVVIFPDLPPSQKGYIISSPEGTEIFFQGIYTSFVYNMVPQAAKLGIKEFDKGKITIFNGENYYLRIRQPESFTGIVCVNDKEGCPYHFSTRSDSLKPPLPESVRVFVIYKNPPIDERILLQSELGEIRLPVPAF
jgi:competence protein ComEC